jgi:2'-5' RNA ligase
MQFNLKSERGKEAFEAVRFYSESGECEWSIGYQVPAGKSRRDKNGTRYIKAIDLFELSFVLFGAHAMTGTLALKAAVIAMAMRTKSSGTVAISKDVFESALKGLTAADDYPADDLDAKAKPGKPKKPVQDTTGNQDGVPPADQPADAPAAAPTDAPADAPAGAPATPPAPPADTPPAPPADAAPADAPLLDTPPADAPPADAPPADAPPADAPPADAPPADATDDPGDPIVDDGEIMLFPDDQGIPDDEEDKPKKPAGKVLAAARRTMKANTHTEPKLPASFVHIELTPLGEVKDTRPGDSSQGARELINWYERGEGAQKYIHWGTEGDFMRCVEIAEKHMTPEQARGFCSNRHLGALGVRPGQEGGGKAFPADTDLVDDPSPDRMAGEAEPEHSGVMVAVYPSPEAADQIAVRGGEKAEELHITLAYLGKTTDDIGNGQTLGDATARIIAAAQIAGATHQTLSGSVGGLGKFPDSGEGVPVWAPVDVVGLGALRESVVTALTDAGLPVKTDHGFTPHMTVGYNLDMALIPPVDGVPVSFDKLVVAVGDAHTEVPIGQDSDVPVSGAPVAGEPLNPPLDDQVKAAAYDPSIETGPDAGHRPAVLTQQKAFPYLEGTYEERQAALVQALREALIPDTDDEDGGPAPAPGLSIDGTWPDRVVCTVHDWSSSNDDRRSWEVPYTYAPDGSILLGDPEKVRLSVIAVDDDGEELDDVPVGDMLPLAEMVESVTAGIKTVALGTEVKAGRVLSSANAIRLRSAVEHLISVLAAAGIEIGQSTDRTGANPTVDDETTAPSARDGGAKALTVDDVANVLSGFENVLQES